MWRNPLPYARKTVMLVWVGERLHAQLLADSFVPSWERGSMDIVKADWPVNRQSRQPPRIRKAYGGRYSEEQRYTRSERKSAMPRW